MKSLILCLMAVSAFAVTAGEVAPKVETPPAPQSPIYMVVRGNEVFASVTADISDLRRALKDGVKNDKGEVVKISETEFKLAVARRLVEQMSASHNAMMQTDAELERRGKELKDRIEQDLQRAKNARPNIVIEK